ncbi:hypothetical protein EIK77_005223 [Talaromyces pinophilus]|nr:hypothetical protein EIK77_005223 [Talaromyces pinophilus]
MLLCGIIDELTKSAPNTTSISFFFCQSTDVRINCATAVLRGLIFMLVDQQPSLMSHVRRQYDKTGKQIFEGVNAWEALSDIFTSILEDPLLKNTYLIIDALDECTTGLNHLLKLVAQKSSAYPHVKWIVSSRNWPPIEETLGSATQNTKLQLELNETSVAEAVAFFINHKVQELTEKKKYNNEIREAVSQHLLSNAHGTFLWVALVCEKLTNVPKRNVQKKLEEFPPGLDELYKRMLDQISDTDDADLCKSLLGVITTVYRPITLDELMSSIDLSAEVTDDSDLAEIIRLCGSFLTLRGRTISLIHQSAKDFLLREAAHDIYPNGADTVHYCIFSKSLGAISRTLRRDIYHLVHPGYSIDQVTQPDPDPLVPIRYACLYWINHLNECSPYRNAIEDLQDGTGLASLLRLEKIQDSYRFILYHKTAIENYPLQVYASALIFSPAKSMTRVEFEEAQKPAWITGKPTMEERWSACLQTLEDHELSVNSVSFSHDSKLLASASDDWTVKVWDASTGQCLQTLKDHEDSVNSVSFSYDSKLLASASDDWTIKVWDASTSQCLQTLEGHEDSVNSVTFSYDSKLLASASDDWTVKVWDASTGQCLQTLEGHEGSIISVTFSYDSKLLASASDDWTTKVWDISTSQYPQTLDSHKGSVKSVVFSYDSKLLASASDDWTVKVWDASTGQCLQTLEGHEDPVNSVTFSYDSKLLASASYDLTIKIWDANTSQCLQTIEGHKHPINKIAFSYDSKVLASASFDCIIKVWDVSTGQYLQTIEGHERLINKLAFSYDAKLLASASYNWTIKVWDTSTGRCLKTIEGHEGLITSATFSYDSKLLASASHDCTIKMWDTSTGQCLQTIKGHEGLITSIAFSYDSKFLASTSDNWTVKVWDAKTGRCLQTLNIGRFASVKSFDTTNSYLELDVGLFRLSLVSDIGLAEPNHEVPLFEGYSVSSDRTWITWNSERLLWLPPEYRPSTPTAISLSTMCFGCHSGRVLLFMFDTPELSNILPEHWI